MDFSAIRKHFGKHGNISQIKESLTSFDLVLRSGKPRILVSLHLHPHEPQPWCLAQNRYLVSFVLFRRNSAYKASIGELGSFTCERTKRGLLVSRHLGKAHRLGLEKDHFL